MNNIKKSAFSLLIILISLVLTGASPWEGSAAAGTGTDLPDRGFFVVTNAFPRDTVVEITNLGTKKTTQVMVSGGLENPGLLALLSREAAAAIGLQSKTVGRIRISQFKGPVDYSRITKTGTTSGDPDFDPKAFVDSNAPKAAQPENLPPAPEPATPVVAEPAALEPAPVAPVVVAPAAPAPKPAPKADTNDIPVIVNVPETKEPAPKPAPKADTNDSPMIVNIPETKAPKAASKDGTNESPMVVNIPGHKPLSPVTVSPPAPVPQEQKKEPEERPVIAEIPLPPPAEEKPQVSKSPGVPPESNYTLVPAEERPPETKAREEEIPSFALTEALPMEEQAPAPSPSPEIDPPRVVSPLPEVPETEPAVPESPKVTAIDPSKVVEPLPETPQPKPPVQTPPKVTVIDPSNVIEPLPPQAKLPVVQTPETLPNVSDAKPEVPAETEPVVVAVKEDKGKFSVPLITDLEKGRYYLQLAALSKPDLVERELAKIDKVWPVAVQSAGSPAKPLYRILVGPMNLGESGALLSRFKSSGYRDAFVRTN